MSARVTVCGANCSMCAMVVNAASWSCAGPLQAIRRSSSSFGCESAVLRPSSECTSAAWPQHSANLEGVRAAVACDKSRSCDAFARTHRVAPDGMHAQHVTCWTPRLISS